MGLCSKKDAVKHAIRNDLSMLRLNYDESLGLGLCAYNFDANFYSLRDLAWAMFDQTNVLLISLLASLHL